MTTVTKEAAERGKPLERGRVALLTPYFPFFDGIFPDEYRDRQEQNARALAGLIAGAGFAVEHMGLTDSSERAVEHGRRLAAQHPDVVVVAPVMAAPATHSLPAVQIVDRPTVLCQVARREAFDSGYTEVQATEDSTLLGCIMAAAGLRGSDRPFVQATLSDEPSRERLARTLDGAIAANRLLGKRVGVLGDTLEGYIDVEMSDAQLQELGLVGVGIPGRELVDAFTAVDGEALAVAYEGLQRCGALFEVGRDELASDLRLAVAFERVVASHQLDALAVNCHGNVMRRSEVVGIPACLAGSVVASAGCPVTCTGDVSTVVALLVGQQFTEKILYCEPFTFEYSTGRVVLGSCGIGNIMMAGPSAARVCANYAYVGRVASGACVRFGLPRSEGTMLAFAPHRSRHGRAGSLLCATGEIMGEYFVNMHGPNTVLELRPGDPRSILERWVAAGPAHHVALAARDLSVELRAMTPFANMDVEIME